MNRHLTLVKGTMPDVVRHLAGVCMLMATSCVHQVAAPLYIGAPTYPETEIGLKDGLLLKHIAGPNCKDESRPEVGTGDTDRTFLVTTKNFGRKNSSNSKNPTVLDNFILSILPIL
jgi:hypothetical protein